MVSNQHHFTHNNEVWAWKIALQIQESTVD